MLSPLRLIALLTFRSSLTALQFSVVTSVVSSIGLGDSLGTRWVSVDPCELKILNTARIEDETRDMVVRIACESQRADLAYKNVPHRRPKHVGFVLET
jgi:hypothetical protein